MNIKLILILTFYLALLLMLPIDAQRNRNRMIRIRNGFRRNGWRNNIAKLRELISFYQYGVDLNDAMRRSDLVRDVVETLENRNMRPLPIRGDTPDRRRQGLGNVICAWCRYTQNWPCIRRWCLNQG